MSNASEGHYSFPVINQRFNYGDLKINAQTELNT